MTDIVERLRDLAAAKHDDLSVADEAADEIERLRADYERLGESVVAWIDCFGALKEDYTKLETALRQIADGWAIDTLNMQHIARAALNGGNDE